MIRLLTSFGTLFFDVAIFTALVLFLWLPYMAWSLTRNVRAIRVQLERLNDILERQSSSQSSGPRIGTLKI